MGWANEQKERKVDISWLHDMAQSYKQPKIDKKNQQQQMNDH